MLEEKGFDKQLVNDAKKMYNYLTEKNNLSSKKSLKKIKFK